MILSTLLVFFQGKWMLVQVYLRVQLHQFLLPLLPLLTLGGLAGRSSLVRGGGDVLLHLFLRVQLKGPSSPLRMSQLGAGVESEAFLAFQTRGIITRFSSSWTCRFPFRRG